MPVVQVWHVGMSVNELRMGVGMGMGVAVDLIDMPVVMVQIIVLVLVLMLRVCVAMFMQVRRAHDGADAREGESEDDELGGHDGLAENRPRDDRADERCDGEDELTSRRTKISCAGNPQRDREAVSEHANEERGDDLADGG